MNTVDQVSVSDATTAPTERSLTLYPEPHSIRRVRLGIPAGEAKRSRSFASSDRPSSTARRGSLDQASAVSRQRNTEGSPILGPSIVCLTYVPLNVVLALFSFFQIRLRVCRRS